MSQAEPLEAEGGVRVGARLPASEYPTSTTQVFRYSAATWNTHRIHYDKAYAEREGYPDVLVQSHLHGAFLVRYCTELAGEHGRLLELGLRVRRFALAGETLTVSATVTAIEDAGEGRAIVSLELGETRGSDGETCVTGSARVEVPAGWLASDEARG
jgi:acyl dehydratase